MMLTLRDVTELRSLQKAMGEQQRQLEIVGQVLAVGGTDFEGFMKGSLAFIERNRICLEADELQRRRCRRALQEHAYD